MFENITNKIGRIGGKLGATRQKILDDILVNESTQDEDDLSNNLATRLDELKFAVGSTELSHLRAESILAELEMRAVAKKWGATEAFALDYLARGVGADKEIVTEARFQANFLFRGLSYEGDLARFKAGLNIQLAALFEGNPIAARDLGINGSDCDPSNEDTGSFLKKARFGGSIEFTMMHEGECSADKMMAQAQKVGIMVRHRSQAVPHLIVPLIEIQVLSLKINN